MSYLSDFYLWVGWQPYAWFALFMVATIADAALTLYALKHGGYEANPVMRRLMAVMTPPVALFVVKALHATAVFAALQFIVLWLPVIALIFVAVCLWNIAQILVHRSVKGSPQ